MNPTVGKSISRFPHWFSNSCLGSHDEGVFEKYKFFENYNSACRTLEYDAEKLETAGRHAE